MPATRKEIDEFHRFALDRWQDRGSQVGLDELLEEWYDVQDGASVREIVARGLAEIDAGTGRPAREVTEELARKHNPPIK